MTQVTNRLGNQNIVELAKKQYETQKRSKLPSVIVNLPSYGKVYPEEHALRSGQVEMRYMTAYDEDILTNTSYIREGVVFDKLLESIIVTPVSISEITTADKDCLIINARILAYGEEYPVKVADPKTKNMLSRVVNLKQLKFKPFDLLADDNGEFDYEFESTKLKFIYLNKDISNLTISEFLLDTIKEVNGTRDTEQIREFIRYEFLARDAKQFRQYVTDNTPGLDMMYEFEGEDGGTFSAVFPIGPDLFWF